MRAIYQDQPAYRAALDYDIVPAAERTPRGSGFVIDCLFSAKAALASGPYEVVVKAAVGFGHDTDTTACVACGLAGLRDGIGAIPVRWQKVLRGADDLAPLRQELVARSS